MSDPYKVLGVSPNATDDEIKTAYRELAKKYHPDNYAESPLADLASEKMKEINEAYDTCLLYTSHNLDLIKTADHIIDLGPEGGDKGGFIVAEGTPEEIAKVESSYTGRYLKKML